MVLFKDIKRFLETLVPLNTQDSWDNSGVQICRSNKPINKIGFAMTPSKNVLSQLTAKDIDLLITHHPISISPFKKLYDLSYPSNFLLELAKRDICVYSIHTNLDISDIGPTAIIAERLSLLDQKPIKVNPPYGIIGHPDKPLKQAYLVKKLKEFLAKDIYRAINYSPETLVKSIGICSGSGASFIDDLIGKVDVYITGDVKYHDAIKAVDNNLTVFDMGHFGTERIFFAKLKDILKQTYPNISYTVLDETSPYEVI